MMGSDPSWDLGDPLGGGGTDSDNGKGQACISVRIGRTEESTSMMMQRFTAYVIEVSDFGRVSEVSLRYSDFEALYKALQIECPSAQFPPLPPKGVDGTDANVVATRKVELEKILRFMLTCPEVMMERELRVFKLLNLPNPAVIASRFVELPRARDGCLKQLTKLMDAKYKDDLYRVGHPRFTDILMEGLRELRSGDPGSGHWCWQQGGRGAICQLLAGALQTSEETRSRLLDAGVIGLLMSVVEREESALDDARLALNVVVAKEGDRFQSLLANFLLSGGLSQLLVLVQRPKCQEFVTKLLWLGWDAPVRRTFTKPGGQGLKLLQVLIKSSTPTCFLLGGVLLAGLAAEELSGDLAYRSEALELVRSALSRTDAAEDPQFAKSLCGSNAAVSRLAGLVEDVELAPLVLGLLCAAKPPAAKLSRMEGNLAALVSGKSAGHREETRAKAAELLLHIQGSTSMAAAPAAASTSSPQDGISSVNSAGGTTMGLERCEGITEHEDSIEKAMRWQLDEGISKNRETLQRKTEAVTTVRALGQQRLESTAAVMPIADFTKFDRSLQAFVAARQALQKQVSDSDSLHRAMERQLSELQAARPSLADDTAYKERLARAERLYSEVKKLKQEHEEAAAEAKERQAAAEASSSDLRRAMDAVKRLDDEISTLRQRQSERESEASKLRHRATMPDLAANKQSAAENLERISSQIRELQIMGQRVQQGDPDYLKDGESRDQKIAELAAKLSNLKKQQQVLEKEAKELEVDPTSLNDQATRLEAEASELRNRMHSLEAQRLEVEKDRLEKSSYSSRGSDEAKQAQDRRANLASRLTAAESEAKSHLGSLQPEIQSHHASWQRLIDQQRKLEADSNLLDGRLSDAKKAAESEEQRRKELAASVAEAITRLQSFQSFLDAIDNNSSCVLSEEGRLPVATEGGMSFGNDFHPPARTKPPAATPGVFDDADDNFEVEGPGAFATASAAIAAEPSRAEPSPLDEL